MSGFTQIIQSQTSITRSSTLFIDHILGKLLELNLEVSTRKNKFRFPKNYAIDAYKNDVRKNFLQTINILKVSIGRIQTSFKNYWESLTRLYSVRLNESKRVLKIGLMGKVLQKLMSRDKLFKTFKKTRLHINKEL